MGDVLKDRVIAAIGDVYDLGEELGRGGMSVVYRALDLRLMRQVAVKVLPPEFSYDSGVRERFRREAQMAAQLNHPNIVPIFSVDERDGIAYFVMAVCDGESLAVRLGRAKRPPLPEVQRLLAEVADALTYAHAKGVVHRDVKPDNILIDRESGRALVTDFGIARAAEAGARLTVTGIAMGTPAYMSPEQALGEHDLDARSDIYSLGAVAYQMVTGVTPFTASNTPSMLLKHVSEQIVPVASRRSDVPPRLASIIERALEKKRESRWQSAGEMRDALLRDNLLASQPRPYVPPVRDARQHESPPRRSPEFSPPTHDHHQRNLADDNDPGWFELWRSEQLATLHKRIRQLRVAAPFTVLSGALLLIMTFAFLIEPDEDFFVAWLLTLAPAATFGGFFLHRAKWLRKRGVGLWRALRAQKSVSYQIEGVSEFGASGIPVPLEVIGGPFGHLVRHAVADRAAIESAMARLPAVDKKMLPEVLPTVHALVERVFVLVPTLHSLDRDIRREDISRLAERLAELEARAVLDGSSDRKLQLLRRQHTSLIDLAKRRDILLAQVESAALLLQNIKLDLLKVGSAGLQAALHDVNNATQEARALSRDIGNLLSAAADIRDL